MIHTWIQIEFRTKCTTATGEMRSGRSLFAGMCANIEDWNYQPKQGGLDRLERKI